MAVERPPIGNHPRNREKGFEKVTTSGVIYHAAPTMSFGSGRYKRRGKYTSRMTISAICVGGGEGKGGVVGGKDGRGGR